MRMLPKTNPKTARRLQRYVAYSSYELTFDESTLIQSAQEHVLSNEINKRRLITLLCDTFQKKGLEVAVAEEDANREIVMTVLSKRALANRVVIQTSTFRKARRAKLVPEVVVTSTNINLTRLPPTEDAASHPPARCRSGRKST